LKNHQLNYINFTQKEVDHLFTSAKNGDKQSFIELSVIVRQISHGYFKSKFSHGKIINKEDVDDLANNVYIAFAEQYEKIENIEYWLRRVLFLNFINWYKKNNQKRTFNIDEAFYLRSMEPNPGDIVDAGKIISELANLSEEKQYIIRMRFWEGLKFTEIAENLKKSEDAVKKMFYRTIEELKGRF
jgi:RNA polymerase sigma-70 factor, ECF subfamily